MRLFHAQLSLDVATTRSRSLRALNVSPQDRARFVRTCRADSNGARSDSLEPHCRLPETDKLARRPRARTSGMTSYVATSSADILLTFRRRPWRFILGGVLVFLVGIGLWLLLNQLLKPAPTPVVPPVPVVAAVAQTGDVSVYLTGLGTVQAYNTVAVHVQVDAT